MDINNVLVQVNGKYSIGDYDGAITILKEALAKGANSKLYVELGNCYFKQRNFQMAINVWEKAIEVNPLDSYAYANLGNLYFAQNNIEKAISVWTGALISRPE